MSAAPDSDLSYWRGIRASVDEQIRAAEERAGIVEPQTEIAGDGRELPPVEAYVGEEPRAHARKANGHDDKPPASALVLRSAAQIASDVQRAVWLLPGLIERNAMLLMFGELGSLKSFLALDWALRVADRGECVIFLHAEGRGLWRRLRAWAVHHYPGVPWSDTLARLPFHAIERPVNLSADGVVLELIAAINALGLKPVLIVVDTMSRNSDGTVERSNEDAQVYLNRLDGGLRALYHCSVLLVHHVGHTNQDRARGPYSLGANTDANYAVERPDIDKLAITLRFGRMKDSESPPPRAYSAEVIELDEMQENGQPFTSLILKPTGEPPPKTQSRKPGKNQQAAGAAIMEWARAHPDALLITSEELRELLKAQEITGKQRRHDAIGHLVTIGILTASVGGHTVNRDALK